MPPFLPLALSNIESLLFFLYKENLFVGFLENL